MVTVRGQECIALYPQSCVRCLQLTEEDSMDFDHSPRAKEYIAKVDAFVRDRILPNEALYHQQLSHDPDFRKWTIPPIMEQLKAEAKAAGLWNLFLPDSTLGAGLDNRDYAPL